MIMGVLSGLFKVRDKPENRISGSAYSHVRHVSDSDKRQILPEYPKLTYFYRFTSRCVWAIIRYIRITILNVTKQNEIVM